ncbi:MAG: FAD-dependent oxidoreductase [Eubacteriales bacterium]|nr:FAD-dependent oxidoreductase [Eubacteriales bacterium]
MYDIIVIGGGMAGMTACLYALRNGKKTLLIEGSSIGGQIAQSPKVENYPTKKQVSGEGLSQELFDQISDLGVEFEFDNIDSIQKIDNIFRLTGEFGVYEGYSVIIANGVKHRKLNLPNEDKLVGHGIYYCALCDGPFFKGREVTLIGDGNTALQYALLLSDIASKVNLVIMFDKFFGDQALVDLVENKPNINIIRNSKTVELKGDSELNSIVFEKSDKTQFEICKTPLFVAIGQIPDNKKFENLADLDEFGYFDSDETTKTKTEGLFVAGDTRKKSVRQVTTAMCDGAISATQACNYLHSIK